MAELELTPDRASIEQMSDFLDQQLEVLEAPMAAAAKLKIAADEIYSNIVYYSGASVAQISCGTAEGQLVLQFRDNGVPYDPLDTPAPDLTATADERAVGGLGIFMVRKMMDAVEYSYQDGWNVLTIRKTP